MPLNPQKIVNDNVREFLNPMKKLNKNSMSINLNESEKHLKLKFLTMLNLIKRGHTVYSEAIFKNGKRADIYDATENMAYECVVTEKEESLLIKDTGYPCSITPVYFKKKEEKK